MKRCFFPASLVSFVPRLIIGLGVLAAMLSLGAGVTHASSGHAPIVIQSDTDFTSCACVVSGKGTTASPYIIGPWTINNVNGSAVSISLFNSNHNALSNNTTDYPFTMNYLITDGSSYNTLSGNEGSTGDFIGLLLSEKREKT